MFKRDTRKSVAWAAITALFSSLLLVGVSTPASADENGVVVQPFAGDSYTMLITEEFAIKTRLGSSVDSSKITQLKYLVQKPAGYGLSTSFRLSNTEVSSPFNANFNAVAMSATQSYITPTTTSNTTINQLIIQPFTGSQGVATTSISSAVDVVVYAFLDVSPDGKLDMDNEPYQKVTISFVPWASVAATLTHNQITAGMVSMSATARVSGVNTQQLNGDWNLRLQVRGTSGTTSATTSSDLDSFITGTNASFSASLAAVESLKNNSISATLYYDKDANGTMAVGERMEFVEYAITTNAITGVTISPTVGDNLRKTGDNSADMRVNSSVAFTAWGYSGSAVVAAGLPTLAISTSATLGTNTYIVLNGTTHTQSSTLPSALALSAASTGKAAVTLSTAGFAGNETIVLTLTKGEYSVVYTVTAKTVTWSVSRAAGSYVTSVAGAAVTADFDVTDQWGVASALADQRVVFSIAGTGFSSSEQIKAVASGAVSVTVTPTPATATGSYTITPNLQYLNRNSGAYSDETANETAVTVYVNAASTNNFVTAPAVSYSASVSYATMSWSSVTATVAHTGSAVTVAGTGVIFKVGTKTYSDTAVVYAAAGGAVSFQVASYTTGNKTVTLTTTSTQSSTIIAFAPAEYNAGHTILWDKTTIYAGETAKITGTLVDSRGNPVATGATASIAVTWTGKGLPFNTSTAMATDADGKFSFNVLVLSGETGEAAISATYKPEGSATSTDNITVVQAITVAAASAATTPSADQKVNAGSFKGYVAVYAKGYAGKRLSAKVGNDWVVVESLASNFERVVEYTGAGYTIGVRIYIDRVLVDTITVTTK